jgi:hypothetical protein
LDLDKRVLVDKKRKRSHHPMPMEDGFNPDHPLPLFLADRPERQSIQQACDRAVISSRVIKASILIAAATATAIVVVSVGSPVTLVAAVTASLVGNSEPQPGSDQPDSTIQSTADAPASIQPTADAPALSQPTAGAPVLSQPTADAQALPPAANDAPPRDEIAVSGPAGKDQAETSQPSSEVLFRQFQAWAAEQDAQANVRPAQPVQDAPTHVAQNAPAQVAENASVPHRLMQKHRHVLPVHSEPAEMHTQNFRKKVRRVQSARVEHPLTQSARVERAPTQSAQAKRPPTQSARANRPPMQSARANRPPMQDAQTQSQAAQNAQVPSFLSIFGQRN